MPLPISVKRGMFRTAFGLFSYGVVGIMFSLPFLFFLSRVLTAVDREHSIMTVMTICRYFSPSSVDQASCMDGVNCGWDVNQPYGSHYLSNFTAITGQCRTPGNDSAGGYWAGESNGQALEVASAWLSAYMHSCKRAFAAGFAMAPIPMVLGLLVMYFKTQIATLCGSFEEWIARKSRGANLSGREKNTIKLVLWVVAFGIMYGINVGIIRAVSSNLLGGISIGEGADFGLDQTVCSTIAYAPPPVNQTALSECFRGLESGAAINFGITEFSLEGCEPEAGTAFCYGQNNGKAIAMMIAMLVGNFSPSDLLTALIVTAMISVAVPLTVAFKDQLKQCFWRLEDVFTCPLGDDKRTYAALK